MPIFDPGSSGIIPLPCILNKDPIAILDLVTAIEFSAVVEFPRVGFALQLIPIKVVQLRAVLVSEVSVKL